MATSDMCDLCNIPTDNKSTSSRKRLLTDINASSGHSWNQSILVQLVMAGNLRLLTRSVLPTGEKHNTTCGRKTNRKYTNCIIIIQLYFDIIKSGTYVYLTYNNLKTFIQHEGNAKTSSVIYTLLLSPYKITVRNQELFYSDIYMYVCMLL